MKPIKNFEGSAKWILRFSIMAYILCLYFNQIKTFDFRSIFYVINLIYVLFSVFLFIGGFQKNATLTIVSGIIISIISIYKIYSSFNGNIFDSSIYLYLMFTGIGLIFTSKGNS